MLELDHAIRFVPAANAVDLTGFTVEPGRAHAGQGTRNVRVMFERSYLEVLWIEHPDQVAARGLDFVGRCARPHTAYPFGCVLRGQIPPVDRPRFRPYELPDAPGIVLQLLARQPLDAPFVAVFETDDCAAMWPAHRAPPAYQVHRNGAARLLCATFRGPVVPPLGALSDVRFLPGEARMTLDLDGTEHTYAP